MWGYTNATAVVLTICILVREGERKREKGNGGKGTQIKPFAFVTLIRYSVKSKRNRLYLNAMSYELPMGTPIQQTGTHYLPMGTQNQQMGIHS